MRGGISSSLPKIKLTVPLEIRWKAGTWCTNEALILLAWVGPKGVWTYISPHSILWCIAVPGRNMVVVVNNRGGKLLA
jgi:hypothetical protein